MAISEPKLESYRSLPGTSRGAGALSGQRGSNRGDAVAMPLGKARCTLAEEGSYFLATNPTIGTGVAGIAATGAFADAESFFCLRNDNSVASGKYIVLDRLTLTTTAAGASGTTTQFASKIDEGDRYTSGGAAVTPVNPNRASSVASGATLYSGALVTTAATSAARLLDSGTLRTVITVVGDKYVFDFGGDTALPSAQATAGVAQLHMLVNHSPVVLGPGDSWVFSMFAASQSGASSFEFALGWWER